MIGKLSAVHLGVLSIIVCCAAAHASSSPAYTATLRSTTKADILTISGRGQFLSTDNKISGLIQILGLNVSADTGRSDVSVPTQITIGVFTSNANTDANFKATGLFSPPGLASGALASRLVFITTNANVITSATTLTLSYRVKIDRKGVITVTCDTKVNRAISIKASSNPSKDSFKLTFTDSTTTPQINTSAINGLAGLPVTGKKSVLSLGDKRTGVGVSNFFLVLGSGKFALAFPATFSKKGMIGDGTKGVGAATLGSPQ